MKTEYGKGRFSALHEIIEYVNQEIYLIKSSPIEPNTPRQITNSGKLKAYQKVLQKLISKKDKTILNDTK